MTIAARVRALEEQALAWTAVASDEDEDEMIRGIADRLLAAAGQGAALPPADPPAPSDPYQYLDWVLDRLGAPARTPGDERTPDGVELSRADRVAALLGTTAKELDRALEQRAAEDLDGSEARVNGRVLR